MNSQADFAQALLKPELPCPMGLTSWNGSSPEHRFAVYRNNVTVSLIDALAETFPVIQALVGEEFFRAMAKVFVQSQPPRSPIMAYYGDDFAEFVQGFPPVRSLPYLADMARLEMCRVWAFHAAEAVPISPAELQQTLADPQQLPTLQLGLHPSVHVVTSNFAIFSLWTAHQDGQCAETVLTDLPQTAMVFRQGLTLETLEIPLGTGQFIRALQAGHTLIEAAAQASSGDPAFDLALAMALLIRLQLVTHINTKGETA